MIVGVGMDLIEINRFDKLLNRRHELWLARLLTEKELLMFEELSTHRRRAEWLAGRFAAKEALLKALGIGMNRGIRMRDIEVLADRLGKPVVQISDAVHRQMGFPYTCHLSITHSASTAGAVVVIERGENA